MYRMLSQLTLNFNVRRYYSWENSIGGGVTDGEIIDYQAYLIDSYISMHFQKDSMTIASLLVLTH